MKQGINIEDVKKYNASLKEYQDKAAQVRAAIEFNTNELNRLCSELSKELGIQVTPENIEQIREERIEKIENTLKVGNEILNRIKSEEANANSAMTSGNYQTPAVQTPVVQAPVFNTSIAQNIVSGDVERDVQEAPVAPEMPKAPITPTGVDISNMPSIFQI